MLMTMNCGFPFNQIRFPQNRKGKQNKLKQKTKILSHRITASKTPTTAAHYILQKKMAFSKELTPYNRKLRLVSPRPIVSPGGDVSKPQQYDNNSTLNTRTKVDLTRHQICPSHYVAQTSSKNRTQDTCHPHDDSATRLSTIMTLTAILRPQ